MEFLEKFSMCFGLFDDVAQIYVQCDNLTAEVTIRPNMDEEHFRSGYRDGIFVFSPGQPHETALGLVVN